MDGIIQYLNTDLDLTSAQNPAQLVAAFEAGGVRTLYGITHSHDGFWYAMFETDKSHNEPEPNIEKMLSVVESLEASLRSIWDGCVRREFNLGYDCGDEPWAFNQGISSKLLARMAAAGASLRITLYPDRE
jgi:hypothetical protein